LNCENRLAKAAQRSSLTRNSQQHRQFRVCEEPVKTLGDAKWRPRVSLAARDAWCVSRRERKREREREREREGAGETGEQNLRDRGRINEMQIAFKSARACLPPPRLAPRVRFGGLTLGFN
jgi:hypothetical protein